MQFELTSSTTREDKSPIRMGRDRSLFPLARRTASFFIFVIEMGKQDNKLSDKWSSVKAVNCAISDGNSSTLLPNTKNLLQIRENVIFERKGVKSRRRSCRKPPPNPWQPYTQRNTLRQSRKLTNACWNGHQFIVCKAELFQIR